MQFAVIHDIVPRCAPVRPQKLPCNGLPVARAGATVRAKHSVHSARSEEPFIDAEQQFRQFRQMIVHLRDLDEAALRNAALANAEYTDNRFLFYIAELERKPSTTGQERAVLARIASNLTYVREWQEGLTQRGLLPTNASSLAQENYQRWRESTQRSSDDEVTPGVSISRLYQAAEKEERKLSSALSSGLASGGLSGGTSQSTLDDFSKRNRAYGDMASAAMARVRARLMGFDADGPSAAANILKGLLLGVGSREERASTLPEAFTPPGLDVNALTPPAHSSGSTPQAGQPLFLVCTPQELLSAVSTLKAELPEPVSTSQQQQSVQLAGSAVPLLLPSGEALSGVLDELAEDVREYDEHVYKHKSPLERMGQPMGW